MFTFSFGSAMAATNYTASDYATALSAEMNNQITYLNNAKVKYLNDLKYNNLGYVKADYTAAAEKDAIAGYTRASIEAGLDAAIASLTAAMQTAISTAANNVPAAGTETAPDLTVVKNAEVTDTTDAIYQVTVATAIANMQTVAIKETNAIEKAQAPATKSAIEAQLAAVDYSKYNTKNEKEYMVNSQYVSAAEKVQSLVDTANDTMKTAAEDNNKTDAGKRTAYEGAYTTFKTELEKVATLEDESQNANEGTKTVAGAVNDYLQYGIQVVYPAIKLVPTADSSVYKLQDATKAQLLANESFYTAKTSSAKAKLFGVEIANIDRITKAEALAVNDAMYKAITESAAAVTKYAGTKASKVPPLWAVTSPAEYKSVGKNLTEDVYNALKAAYGKLYWKDGDTYKESASYGTGEYFVMTKAAGLAGDLATFLNTLGNAMDVADTYADVVALGDKMKAEVSYGVKVYDDEKVDAAVKKAEELVYGDLGSTLKTAQAYIDAAAADLGYSSLNAVNYEYQKFMKAIADAKAKFYKADGTPQGKVLYGEDKTAEADYVYLKATYAAACADDWTEIAADAVAALNNAESYADIEAALAEAKDSLGDLILAADAAKVANAKISYKAALASFITGQTAILGADAVKYSKALAEVKAAGDELIDDATTVAGVEAAYADAQALVKALKTNDELTAEKNAVIAAITALPLQANLTVADKEKVMEAFNAYKAYVETPGAAVTDITNQTILKGDVEKVLNAQRDALLEKIADTKKAIDKLYDTSDNDAKKIAEMRADMETLTAEATAFNKELKAIKKVEGFTQLNVQDIDNAIESLLDSEAKVWKAELRVARVLAVAATKPTATAADRKAALDAYKALTDRQKYKMDSDYYELIKRVSEYAISDVESIKIKASSKATKGAMTIKWRVVGGDKSAAQGYQVARSTKLKSGFKTMIKTAKMSYKNTKGLKKGTRYYYKVRAYKVVDGKNVYSDWSNKAYRVAK